MKKFPKHKPGDKWHLLGWRLEPAAEMDGMNTSMLIMSIGIERAKKKKRAKQ